MLQTHNCSLTYSRVLFEYIFSVVITAPFALYTISPTVRQPNRKNVRMELTSRTCSMGLIYPVLGAEVGMPRQQYDTLPRGPTRPVQECRWYFPVLEVARILYSAFTEPIIFARSTPSQPREVVFSLLACVHIAPPSWLPTRCVNNNHLVYSR